MIEGAYLYILNRLSNLTWEESGYRLLGAVFGVIFWSLIFGWLAQRERTRIACGYRTTGEKLRHKAYVLGCHLSRYLARKRRVSRHLIADTTFKHPRQSD